MTSTTDPDDLVSCVRRDLGRNLLRARNGVKYMAGIDRPQVGTTPKDVVWQSGKTQLWRYRSDTVTAGTPVLIVMSLVSRSYILDLYPGASFVEALRDAGFDVFLLDWGVPDEREADNGLSTYVEELLPAGIERVLQDSGAQELHLIGYCLGGLLSLLLGVVPRLRCCDVLCCVSPVFAWKRCRS